jgi:hypothetical protein
MKRVGKTVCLLLILVTLSIGSLIIKPTSAQSVSKPSVPEFTLEYKTETSFHDAQWKIDPYTGENITITPAYSENWSEIVLTIKSQPFTSFKDSNGNWIELYYIVASKGNYETLWENISTGSGERLTQSDSEYTSIGYSAQFYPPNAKVDFRVEAMIGYFKDSSLPSYLGIPPIFVGKESGWSNTLTISIPDSLVSVSSSPNPNPTQTPSVPEFSWLIILPLFLSILSIAIIVGVRKSRNVTQHYTYLMDYEKQSLGRFPFE